MINEETIDTSYDEGYADGLKEAAAEILRLRAENEKLRAENIGLFARLDKAHSFISRADWMQFFEEEQEPAAALKETGE